MLPYNEIVAAWIDPFYDAGADPHTSIIGNIVDAAVWTDVGCETWMISGKQTLGNDLDFCFSYMDADEWECGASACIAAQESGSDTDAINLGLFYTMPAGIELRLTYSEVSNERNSDYDFSINVGGAKIGQDIEIIVVGIVHWFD